VAVKFLINNQEKPMKKQLITILTLGFCIAFLTGCGRKVTYINLPQAQSGQPVRIAQDVYARQSMPQFPTPTYINVNDNKYHIVRKGETFEASETFNENNLRSTSFNCVFTNIHMGNYRDYTSDFRINNVVIKETIQHIYGPTYPTIIENDGINIPVVAKNYNILNVKTIIFRLRNDVKNPVKVICGNNLRAPSNIVIPPTP
jgi:hypothetical protein